MLPGQHLTGGEYKIEFGGATGAQDQGPAEQLVERINPPA